MLVQLVTFLLVGHLVIAQRGRDYAARPNDDNTPESGTLLIRCYGRWGCFSIGGPFFSSARPVSVFPLHPDVLDVRFLLSTRSNPDVYNVLKSRDNTSVSLSNFDSSRPVKIIIHDYKENGDTQWIQDMTRELLTADSYNVISVDWGAGAVPPYTQAVANARIVGVVIADFIQYLEEKFRRPLTEFHLIGQGLGAHVAGYAGENARGIARITGLDPSSSYFENTPAEVRLDPTDAQFVDVIHTDAAVPGEGTIRPVGHLDFYPNGGNLQPGCYEGIVAPSPEGRYTYVTPDGNNLQVDLRYAARKKRDHGRTKRDGGSMQYVNCNHVRAYELFMESINSDCAFYGYECDSYQNFTSGGCTMGCGPDRKGCAPMGMNANEWKQNVPVGVEGVINIVPVKMYSDTWYQHPFCQNHYHVQLRVSNAVEARNHGNETGRLFIRLTGSKGRTSFVETGQRDGELYIPGKTADAMISGPNLGRLLRLDAQWVPNRLRSRHPYSAGPNSYRFSELYVDYFSVENLEAGFRSVFCNDEEPMKPDKIKTLFPGGTCQAF